MYTTSPSLRRARSAGPTGVPSSLSSIRTSSSRITVTGAVSPVRLGGWPATGTPRLRSACPFALHRGSPSPVRLGGWPATGTPRLRSACPFALHRGSPSPVRLGGWPATGTPRLRSACPFRRPGSAPLPPSRTVSFHALTAVAVGEPHGVGPKLHPPARVNPPRRPPRRETDAVHPDGQPA